MRLDRESTRRLLAPAAVFDIVDISNQQVRWVPRRLRHNLGAVVYGEYRRNQRRRRHKTRDTKGTKEAKSTKTFVSLVLFAFAAPEWDFVHGHQECST
jgi:hypothetical protein